MSLDFIDILKDSNGYEDYSLTLFKSTSLFSKYYKEYHQQKFTDLSFLVMAEQKILGYVLCSTLEGALTFPDGGILIDLKLASSIKEQKAIYFQILRHLQTIARAQNCKRISIKDKLQEGSLSLLGEALFNQGFACKLTFEMAIDFENFNQEKFHASLRKSYKSLINWGKKELRIMSINKDNPDLKSFKKFQDFHYRISGRKTRSDESWLLQYQMIQEGIGELILADYNNQTVAGGLFTDHASASVYFTGVYERDLFEFGVSHFLVYEGILRSYWRKQTSKFSFGYFDAGTQDSKWRNIQFFKKGFCSELSPTILWQAELT